MAQTNHQMTIADAVAMLDKVLGRTLVKQEEIYEDLGNIRQMIPQLVTHYESSLIEAKKVTQELDGQVTAAKDHISTLERLLGEHLAADQIPQRPDKLRPPDVTPPAQPKT